MTLKHCWEIMKCGRQHDGEKVVALGECIASTEAMTHSCWAVAGTLCGGVVQGSVAQKEQNCVACPVFALFSRSCGEMREQLESEYPEEYAKYRDLMRTRAHSIK
jgi:hypothetical protein